MKRSSNIDWPALIERQTKSGIPQKRFCTEQGVAISTFQYWKKRLRENTSIELHRPQFIELDVRPSNGVFASQGSEGLVVELPFGVIMRFPELAH